MAVLLNKLTNNPAIRLLKLQYIFVILSTNLITSCSDQPVVGTWKLQRVQLVDMMHSNTFDIDLTNTVKLKEDMLKHMLEERKEEGRDIDTAEIKTEIDKSLSSYLKSELALLSSKKFTMKSNGLIVPSVIAGWHFGNTLEGEWKMNKDTLILSIGDNPRHYTWKFKILELTSRVLKLQGVVQGVEGTTEMLKGPSSELDFNRL